MNYNASKTPCVKYFLQIEFDKKLSQVISSLHSCDTTQIHTYYSGPGPRPHMCMWHINDKNIFPIHKKFKILLECTKSLPDSSNLTLWSSILRECNIQCQIWIIFVRLFTLLTRPLNIIFADKNCKKLLGGSNFDASMMDWKIRVTSGYCCYNS